MRAQIVLVDEHLSVRLEDVIYDGVETGRKARCDDKSWSVGLCTRLASARKQINLWFLLINLSVSE